MIRGLEARRVEADWAPAAAAPWYTLRRGPDGQDHAFLSYRGDGCVFLREDGLCAIHALYGAESKPGFCRSFPIELVEEPRGIAVVARPACDRLFESSRDGQPLSEVAAEVYAQRRLAPRRRFAPERVETLPGVWLDTPRWLSLEDALREALWEHREDPELRVARLVRRLAAESGVAPPEPRLPAYQLAARAVFEALRIYLGFILQGEAGAPAHRVAFIQAVLSDVEEARYAPELRAPLTPEAMDYAGLLLRSALLAKDVHTLGSVSAGLGEWLAGMLLAVAVHRVGSDEPVTAADLARVHSRWVKLAAHPAIREVLRKARPALVDLVLHAGAPQEN
ncbi:MAG: hypothetical protein JXX28_06740 [Deltaproteobacteria bacterium]|nr:hypothetical protein [Deltaproteobacteria bacterium]